MGLKPVLLSLGLLLGANAWGDECQLSLNETVLDFGLMNRAIALVPADERLLGERRLSLTLNCPNPTDMSLFYRGIAAGAERFQFTSRGSYSLRASDALLDGQAVELGLLACGQRPACRQHRRHPALAPGARHRADARRGAGQWAQLVVAA